MVNYQNGKIYTIRCRSDENLIYVGSTTQKLTQRLAKHRSSCKRGVGCSIYKYIVNDDWSEWYIELYEMYPCNSKKELERREGQVIREIGTINKNIAGRTKKEYYEMNADIIKGDKKKYYEMNADIIKEKIKIHRVVNADKVKETRKKYYDNNIEKIKEKGKMLICCNICNAFMRADSIYKHQKTKKCMSALN